MSSLSNNPNSVYQWWIDEEPTHLKRNREEDDDEEEEEGELVEERPTKQLKIEEEEEEEEFFEAVGGEAEGTPAQVKRKREEEEVEEPPKKQQKVHEQEEEEEEFHEAREATDAELAEAEEAVKAAAAAFESAKKEQQEIIEILSDHEVIELSDDEEDEDEDEDEDDDDDADDDEAAPPALVKVLTEEENARVSAALRPNQSGIVSLHRNTTVEYSDIYRLYPETWLNDEIINFYMMLLVDRAEADESLPQIHCLNTFFCSTLREKGYQKVRRWTRSVDIFAKELILIPINRERHWTLGVIDMKKKEVQVYDSMGGRHQHILRLLLRYLQQEHQDKKHMPLDISDWEMKTPKDIPQQKNGSDCGAFACTFAERLACRGEFDFSQQDMRILRRRMVLNILDKHL